MCVRLRVCLNTFDLHVCDLPSQILSVCRPLTWWRLAWLRLHHNEMEAFQCAEHRQITAITPLHPERWSSVCVCWQNAAESNRISSQRRVSLCVSVRVELYWSVIEVPKLIKWGNEAMGGEGNGRRMKVSRLWDQDHRGILWLFTLISLMIHDSRRFIVVIKIRHVAEAWLWCWFIMEIHL